MKKNSAMIALCLALCLLSGCQLAQEEAGCAEQARLIGYFVTCEPLEGEQTARFADEEYLFDCAGSRFFLPEYASESGPVLSIQCDEEITAHGLHLSVTDESEHMEAEGTLRMVQQATQKILYMNPVYQRADESVYALPGSGMAFHGEMGTGEVYSQSISETVSTTTPDGIKKERSIDLTLRVEVQPAPQSIRLLQMDAEGNCLSRTSYQPGALPEQIGLERTADYLIVEIISDQGTTRQLVSDFEEPLTTWYACPDGLIVPQQTQLIHK